MQVLLREKQAKVHQQLCQTLTQLIFPNCEFIEFKSLYEFKNEKVWFEDSSVLEVVFFNMDKASLMKWEVNLYCTQKEKQLKGLNPPTGP